MFTIEGGLATETERKGINIIRYYTTKIGHSLLPRPTSPPFTDKNGGGGGSGYETRLDIEQSRAKTTKI